MQGLDLEQAKISQRQQKTQNMVYGIGDYCHRGLCALFVFQSYIHFPFIL